MSYILEALKKAESERQSGTSHAAALPPGLDALARKPQASTKKPWLWLGFALLIAALAGAAFIAFRDEPPAAAVAENPVPPPHTAALSAAAAPEIASPPLAPIAPPAAPPEKPKEKIAKKNPDKKQLAAIPEQTAKPAQGGKADDHIVTLHDLPEQIRREIPAFTIGGYIYSGNRADRSVLINNRLLREGDNIAPGLVLEQMTPNGVVLSYKGHRYRASY
ncbi:MAG TPA: general secretion pathway protein GspB [Noviherbaspirillum sp.]|nr:general secretion pathway protein GspB [Noviherbaspirillum sp.]